MISWRDLAATVRLQYTTDLINWFGVTNQTTDANGVNIVTYAITGKLKFYRLVNVSAGEAPSANGESDDAFVAVMSDRKLSAVEDFFDRLKLIFKRREKSISFDDPLDECEVEV